MKHHQIEASDKQALAERALLIARELERRQTQERFYHFFPDETHEWRGETYHARRLYQKAMEFFAASRTFRESCMMAANRTGKTVCGGYALACHVTGHYPDWWPGRRFSGPIRAWASGKTNETTKDIVQTELLGPVIADGARRSVSGTGMIPGEYLGPMRWKQGVADLCDTIKVKHKSGGWSSLGFKAYHQGRGAFEGTAQHVIWLDEEPPMEVYTECLTRTATTDGLLMATFTPLEGMSSVAMMFLPDEMRPDAS